MFVFIILKKAQGGCTTGGINKCYNATTDMYNKPALGATFFEISSFLVLNQGTQIMLSDSGNSIIRTLESSNQGNVFPN